MTSGAQVDGLHALLKLAQKLSLLSDADPSVAESEAGAPADTSSPTIARPPPISLGTADSAPVRPGRIRLNGAYEARGMKSDDLELELPYMMNHDASNDGYNEMAHRHAPALDNDDDANPYHQ